MTDLGEGDCPYFQGQRLSNHMSGNEPGNLDLLSLVVNSFAKFSVAFFPAMPALGDPPKAAVGSSPHLLLPETGEPLRWLSDHTMFLRIMMSDSHAEGNRFFREERAVGSGNTVPVDLVMQPAANDNDVSLKQIISRASMDDSSKNGAVSTRGGAGGHEGRDRHRGVWKEQGIGRENKGKGKKGKDEKGGKGGEKK